MSQPNPAIHQPHTHAQQSDSTDFITTKLSPQQQQTLFTTIANILLTPISNSRVNTITQKFTDIQSQVISVVEHRVRLQQYLQQQKIKDDRFDTIHKLYEKIKQKDKQINHFGKVNAELDRKYLMKVAELEELRVNFMTLKGEVESLRDQLQRVKNLGGMSSSLRNENDQANDIKQITLEIISLKQTFRKTFSKSLQNSDSYQLKVNQLNEPLSQNKNTQPHKPNSLQPSSLLQKLQQQLSLLKSSLSLRLQIIQQSSQTTNKYQSTQQQLINRLMDELIRQKSISCNFLSNETSTQVYGSKRDLAEQGRQINQAYEKSNNDLNRILEMELVRMKQKWEDYEQNYGKNQESLKDSEQKLRQLRQLINQKENQITKLKHQLQQQKATNQATLKQLQLLNSSKLQQLQLNHLQQKHSLTQQIHQNNSTIQKLKSQLQTTRTQSQTTHNQQLTKAHQQINRLLEANQSLSNQKILIKTLHKKLNKQAIDANDEKKKALEERDKLMVQNQQIIAIRDRLVEDNAKLQGKNKQLLEENRSLRGNVDSMKQEITRIYAKLNLVKQQIEKRIEEVVNKQDELKQIKLQLSIKIDTLVEIQNQLITKNNIISQKQAQLRQLQSNIISSQLHLKQLQNKLQQTDQLLSQTTNEMKQSQSKLQNQLTTQQQQYQTKLNYLQISIKQSSHKISQLSQQKSSMAIKISNYQQTVFNLQLEIRKLNLTIDQRNQQIQLLNNLSIQHKHQQVKLKTQGEQQSQDKGDQQESTNISERQNALILRENRLNLLIGNIKSAQGQLQQKQIQLLQQQSSIHKTLSQTQQSLKQKQLSLSLKQQSLNQQQSSLSQRQLSIIQRQQQLKIKQSEYETNFNQSKQMFMNEAYQLQLREIQLSNTINQLTQIQRQLLSRTQQINQKQLYLQVKSQQLNQKQQQITNSLQQLQHQKKTLLQLKQSIQQSRQQPLSPPPSPFQHPIQSPDSPSLLKLQSSRKIISTTVSQTYKGRFSQLRVYPNLPNMRQENDIPSEDLSKIPGLQQVDEICKMIADDWMRTQQDKWNLLHYQVDSLAQLVMEADI